MNNLPPFFSSFSASSLPRATSGGGMGTAVLEERTSAVLEELRLDESAGISLLPMPDFIEKSDREPFRYCLNTSTLKGHNLTLPELVDVAAGAGYEAIEPWVGEIEKWAAEGGDLRGLRSKIADLGLTVEGGIGFFEWIVDDDARRKQGMDDAKKSMGLLARLGGKRVAAPPWGAHQVGSPKVNLLAAADRYRELLVMGEQTGVVPQMEMWGFSENVNKLSEATLIATEAGHPDANILADVYHLYKGGSPLPGLRLMSGDAFPLFHVNDYPAISPKEITDKDRVFPGDGVAPLTTIFRTLRDIGFTGVLSLELFNETYYAQDPLSVAREGLDKLREAVQKSFS